MMFDRLWVQQLFDRAGADGDDRGGIGAAHLAFVLDFGTTSFLARLERGSLVSLREAPHAFDECAFALRAAESTWREIFAPVPRPMFHDLLAAIAQEKLRFEGDVKRFLRLLPLLNRLVRAARETAGAAATARPDPPLPATPRAVGRYVNVELEGLTYPVFYFESGQGVPILCQHTAGNENRQWRHLLEDEELCRQYRVIAYDLPGHGKSYPPQGTRFWEAERPLTSDWVTRFVVALGEALGLDRPIFLGCSIGGVIALHLAERFPEAFRACIALAGAVPTGGFDRAWWVHPELNTAMMIGAVTHGVQAPDAPTWNRELANWFQRSNPSNLRDDLFLWCEDNSDPKRANRIDAERLPVFLAAGEYDYTCPPEVIRACAEQIGPAAAYETLKGLGHFPMSEDYDRFRPYLMKVLAEIGKRIR